MIRPASKLLLSSLVTVALGAANQGNAAIFLTQHFSGTLGSGTTLGGAAVAEDTAFSYSATFDPTTMADLEAGQAAIFSVTDFSVTIDGYGTYTADPANWSVILSDGSAGGPFGGFYLSGMVRNSGEPESYGFLNFFSTTTPAFSQSSPAATVFSGYVGTFGSTVITVDLTGVSGGLVFSSISGSSAASITAVPEPAETAIAIGIGLAAFALIRNKRREAGI